MISEKSKAADRINATAEALYSWAVLIPMPKLLKEIEMEMIRVALADTNYNQTKAAVSLGIKRTTLSEKCKRYGMRA